MDDKEKSQICEEAELYYLSLAFGSEYGDVPEQIAVHVKSCDHCRRRLEMLEDQLLTADAIDSDDSRLSKAQMHVLGLHFAYLGKEVGCETVKPFLASLLEPTFNVRIPTPISVHIHRCEVCSRDLATLQAMGLTGKQLKVLNSILGNDSSVQNVDCSVAAASIQQYVSFNFQTIEPEVVKHLCCCKVCLSLVYKARALNIKSLYGKNVKTVFPCDSVTFSDIFDYCFPYGLVPYKNQYASFREPFVNELRQCAKCLQKVQELHQKVYAIKQRPGSGMVTVYDVGEVPKSDAAPEKQNNYGGFPINVRVIRSSDKQLLQGARRKYAVGPDEKPRTIKIGFRFVAKAAVVAIAVLAVAFLMWSTPRATAVTIQQVYDAIQKAVNVHIQQFTAEISEPLQEKWVSKDLGIYAVRDETDFVVWDITTRKKYSKPVGAQRFEAIPLSEIQTAEIEKRIRGSLGIMPFENAFQVPRDAEWRELDTSKLESVSTNTRVYELIWTRPAKNGLILHLKWLGFIEKATNRPLRIEFYRYDNDTGEYKLETIHSIEYWTENQIQTLLQELQF